MFTLKLLYCVYYDILPSLHFLLKYSIIYKIILLDIHLNLA